MALEIMILFSREVSDAIMDSCRQQGLRLVVQQRLNAHQGKLVPWHAFLFEDGFVAILIKLQAQISRNTHRLEW